MDHSPEVCHVNIKSKSLLIGTLKLEGQPLKFIIRRRFVKIEIYSF